MDAMITSVANIEEITPLKRIGSISNYIVYKKYLHEKYMMKYIRKLNLLPTMSFVFQFHAPALFSYESKYVLAL